MADRIIYAADFQPAMMDKYKRLPAPKGNPKGRSKKRYRDCICAFDIETTTIEYKGQEVNFMYIWQFCVNGEYAVIGRTWDAFRKFIGKIRQGIGLDALAIYVHNLAYEWQYIKSLYEFKQEDVFAVDSRKVIRCVMYDQLEFRCSLALSNMSLHEYTKAMNVQHQKLSGDEFNYNKIRYPWTPLTAYELQYSVNDVFGLVEAVRQEMALNGDTLYTVPMTSTGYPRRDIKRMMRRYPRRLITALQPTYEVYQLLRAAFRGGDTHANRYYAGKILPGVIGFDRSSSYPDIMVNDMFPMSAFVKGEASVENLRNLIKNGYAVLFSCDLYGVRLADRYNGDPYIPLDKCPYSARITTDNGRILSADFIQIVGLTDVDFRIILETYRFEDININVLYFAEYGPLPAPMRYVVNNYYKQKTELKGKDDPDSKLYYGLAKARLNSLYGMLAQDPVKQSQIWTGQEFILDETDPEQLLSDYNRKTFGSYAWGVWVTAWARYRLYQGIKIAGNQDFVYCDTDSVKYIDHGQDWTAYNEIRKKHSASNGGSAVDAQGITHYMGVYEPEVNCAEFITLGAKRYAYTDDTGRIHLTCSGVDKKKGAAELKTLENFKDGFIFWDSGKTEVDYVDNPISNRIIIDDTPIEITSYAIIHDSVYTLGLSYEYRNLLTLINSAK